MGIIGDWTDKSFTVKVPFTYQSSAMAYKETCNGDKATVSWYVGETPPWNATRIDAYERNTKNQMMIQRQKMAKARAEGMGACMIKNETGQKLMVSGGAEGNMVSTVSIGKTRERICMGGSLKKSP